MNLRIATLNTYYWAAGPWGIWWQAKGLKERLRLAAEWIRSQDADVVFLQEVLWPGDAKALSRNSGMPHTYFPGYGSGLCILSRHPLSDRKFFSFRWQGSYSVEALRLVARLKNGVASARLQTPDGRQVSLFATHLLARYKEIPKFYEPSDSLTPERKVNLLELGRYVAEQTGVAEPWVMAGDFNMNPRSDEAAFFSGFGGVRDALKTHSEAQGVEWRGQATYADDNPWVREQGNPSEGILDYIFFADGAFSVANARIAKETDAFSDHRAVVAELEWRGEAGRPISLPVLSRLEREELDRYFKQVRLPLASYLAPTVGWTQRRDIRRFLHLL